MKHKKIILTVPLLLGILIFVTVPLGESNNNHQAKISCVNTFDNIIVPIINGEMKPSQLASEQWRKFEVQKCATNHSQWEKSSIYFDGSINWELLIANE